jgi:hypothetical protein
MLLHRRKIVEERKEKKKRTWEARAPIGPVAERLGAHLVLRQFTPVNAQTL